VVAALNGDVGQDCDTTALVDIFGVAIVDLAAFIFRFCRSRSHSRSGSHIAANVTSLSGMY
jgi:hypothetical protein